MVQAALLERPNQPLQVAEIDLDGPFPDEVMVEMGATGVCHSDIAVYTGALPNPFPVVLGHEGAGTVVAVGEGVYHCPRGRPRGVGVVGAMWRVLLLPAPAARAL